MSWFLNNVARNSRVNLSKVEIGSLELQRLWVLLKVQTIELRATLGGVFSLALVILRFPNNVACNSHVNLSNVEIGSLELQRF